MDGGALMFLTGHRIRTRSSQALTMDLVGKYAISAQAWVLAIIFNFALRSENVERVWSFHVIMT